MQRIAPLSAVAAVLLVGAALFVFVGHAVGTSEATVAPVVAVRTGTLPPASLPATTAPLTHSPLQTQFGFDSVNSQPSGGLQSTFVVPRGTTIRVRGWAIDLPNQKLAGGVILSVDNAVDIAASYDEERPDVATQFANVAYLKSGFNADILTDEFSIGLHLIAIKIISSDATAYYQPLVAIAIEITG